MDKIDIDEQIKENGIGATILELIYARDEIADEIKECDEKRKSLNKAWEDLRSSMDGVFSYIEKNDPELYDKLKVAGCPIYRLRIMSKGRLHTVEQNRGYQEKSPSRISISSEKVEVV